MRWLRENWLDFLIFVLIAVVAVGVVLYLVGLNPFAARPAPPPAPQAPAATAPGPAGEAPAEEPVVTVLPLPEAPPASSPGEASGRAPVSAPSPSEPARSSAGAASPPASPQGVYRVAVGAFANPENAARLRQALADQGYPARLEPAGSLTRVVVGPYATEAEARRVAEALRDYAPQVYRGEGPAPLSPERVYLQVGAFQKRENALALAEKLRGLGFSVVLSEDGLHRVRVGPVPVGQVDEVKARLKALGLEALEVR